MKTTGIIAIAATACAVVGAGSFFGGVQYQKSHLPGIDGARFAANAGSGAQGFLQNIPSDQRQKVMQELQQAKTPAERQRILQTYGVNGGARGGSGPNGTEGTIIGRDDSSITIKMPDGSSKIVYLKSDTKISTQQQAAATDLKESLNVSVRGTPNSDGSLSASAIQVLEKNPS